MRISNLQVIAPDLHIDMIKELNDIISSDYYCTRPVINTVGLHVQCIHLDFNIYMMLIVSVWTCVKVTPTHGSFVPGCAGHGL